MIKAEIPSRSSRIWVFGLGIGIMLMIVLGGYTRLTHAGLSLVDWKPVMGFIPPLSNADWQSEWLRYQAFPEFQQGVVTDFTLFQKLFWIEYAHRLLGRLVGLWLLGGLAWGIVMHRYPRWLTRKGVFWALGIAFQGWMGWYMVQSGLIHNPQVSPYRLTIHLWIALILLTSVAATYQNLRHINPVQKMPWHAVTAQIMVGLTLTFGGLVAGHKAGLIYNTFPLMEGHWIPSDAWFYEPIWINLWSNPVCVQALHRYMALLTLILITYNAFQLRTKNAWIWCTIAYTQGGLGVATLLTQVSLHPALTHQACGIMLWLWGWLMMRPRPK